MKCDRCFEVNAETLLFCGTCGYLLRSNEEVECENHPGAVAVGVCVVCGKPVCGDCSVSRGGKIYCDDVAHSQMDADFIRLAYAANEFEADIIVKNFSLNGVPACHFTAKSFVQFFPFAGVLPVSVFVQKESAAEAKRLLKELDLEEFLTF
jgi:hypothetical protein